MGKKAFISRHIVLCSNSITKCSKPVYGIILIDNEVIYDVITLEKDIQVYEVIEKYYDWNPVDCEDLYISPGLIDLNVRREWEDYSHLTKAAIAGGVSFLVEEVGYYVDHPTSTGELFCDIGKLATVDISSFERIRELSGQGYLGVRGYLFPPSSTVQSIPNNLNVVFSEISQMQMVLFLDPTLANPRMLYIASPMRLVGLEERFQSSALSGSPAKIFAGAYAENAVESEESDKDEEEEIPVARLRRMTMCIDSYSTPIKSRSNSDMWTDVVSKHDPELPINAITEADEQEELSPKKLKKNLMTIFDDLDKRIKESYQSIENLSLAEQNTYTNSGSTNFTSLSPSRCNPVDNEHKQENSYRSRIEKRRPPSLSIKNEDKALKEQAYLLHLANYPEHWETSGVEKVIQELKKTSCRVHITNISSAAAINRVRQAKEEFPLLTCEIPAYHLSFTSAAIKDGDTRFKTSPPIRNQSNLMLLWDLLKMNAIDSISSQHASIKPEHKALHSGNFQKALNGVNSLGFTLQAVWTMLNAPASTSSQLEHYIVRLAKWMSLRPARILNIDDTRGSIEKGKYADLIIWDPYSRFRVREIQSQYPEVSPFINMDLMGKIHQVYLRGKLAFSDNEFYPRGKKVLKLDA